MPLIFQKELAGGGKYGVWRVSESPAYFLDQLDLFETESLELNALSERKQIEWLASRFLLHLMLGESDRIPCLKDRHGKPHLDGSKFQISLSHSRDLVAVAIHPSLCGIDVQYPVDKIPRISRKFVNDMEQTYLSEANLLKYLHTIWGAKESIYKAYGRKGLDFKNEIRIDPFLFEDKGFEFTGLLQRETITMEFRCTVEMVEDNYLVNAVAI